MATVLDRLHEIAPTASDEAYGRILRVLASVLPVDRHVELTDDVLRAAADGDVALVVTLLAPEQEPDEQDRELLRELQSGPADARELVSLDEAKRELGL